MKEFIDLTNILWYLVDEKESGEIISVEAEEEVQALFSTYNSKFSDKKTENDFYCDVSEVINKYLEDGFIAGFKTAISLLKQGE